MLRLIPVLQHLAICVEHALWAEKQSSQIFSLRRKPTKMSQGLLHPPSPFDFLDSFSTRPGSLSPVNPHHALRPSVLGRIDQVGALRSWTLRLSVSRDFTPMANFRDRPPATLRSDFALARRSTTFEPSSTILGAIPRFYAQLPSHAQSLLTTFTTTYLTSSQALACRLGHRSLKRVRQSSGCDGDIHAGHG